jgi:integrase
MRPKPLLQKRKELQEGKDPIPLKKIPNFIFAELADRYLEWAIRQRSFLRKKVIIKQLVKEFGNVPLRCFSTSLVEGYQSRMLNEGKKPATANRHLAGIKHMFTKAIDWEMVEEESLERVRRVKLLQENNRRLRFLSKEECTALVNACSPHLRPIVLIALNTGMRKEEILSLAREKHIDLRHGFILLDHTKNGERREVPINQTVTAVLTGITRRIGSPYVFTNEEGSDTGMLRSHSMRPAGGQG